MTDTREIEALCAEAEGLDESGTLHPVYPVRVLAPRMAATLRALAAQLAAAQTENTHLRAALAQSKDPCVYCQLPAEEMARCRSGFPGCARADDMAGCPEFGASMEVHSLREQLAAARADSERLDWLDRVLQAGLEGEVAERMTRVWDGDLRSFIDKASVVGYAAIDAAKGGV